MPLPGNGARNSRMVCLNDYRKNPQAHGYSAVAFHPVSTRVSLLYFPKGGHEVKEFTWYIIKIE